MTTQSQPPPYQPGGSYRHILHADLDAFYAAVEVLDNPDLDGKAVMVGGDPENRGVVATASYEARVFGVHSAMPMRTAVRLCPQGIIIHPRFDRYRQMSRAVMDVFHDFTELVEPLSMDEAYLDITEAVDAGRLPFRSPGGTPPRPGITGSTCSWPRAFRPKRRCGRGWLSWHGTKPRSSPQGTTRYVFTVEPDRGINRRREPAPGERDRRRVEAKKWGSRGAGGTAWVAKAGGGQGRDGRAHV